MTFLQWCKEKQNDISAVGRFCREWVLDQERPRSPRKLYHVLSYMRDAGACPDALRCASEAWMKYRARLRAER